jgi:hypothetical protein
MAIQPFETAYASGYPTVDQLSVFLENRVGQLLRLTKLFDKTNVRILALSIVNFVDCALVRMILDDPETAYDRLRAAGLAVSQNEILVVALPKGKRGLLKTWTTLLSAEINVAYTYPLLVHPGGQSAMAVLADDLELAAKVLHEKGLTVLDQSDLAAKP